LKVNILIWEITEEILHPWFRRFGLAVWEDMGNRERFAQQSRLTVLMLERAAELNLLFTFESTPQHALDVFQVSWNHQVLMPYNVNTATCPMWVSLQDCRVQRVFDLFELRLLNMHQNRMH